MPIYDFECQKCSKKFEFIVNPGETITRCFDCGGEAHKTMTPTTHKSYSINGNNDASVTPKRYRKEDK